ncbi:hypothetical protein Pcinc_030555 [Petrolisthes cinctipes]|uniref:Uncharacterized protein n=1 Tax=Petrolisthes cinctipes TaxID=88211 RepID=A0AAE1EXW7_PETCI|nr:hypothetical protein Pcinc_030555 [Petrolisthes cinctipes]
MYTCECYPLPDLMATVLCCCWSSCFSCCLCVGCVCQLTKFDSLSASQPSTQVNPSGFTWLLDLLPPRLAVFTTASTLLSSSSHSTTISSPNLFLFLL